MTYVGQPGAQMALTDDDRTPPAGIDMGDRLALERSFARRQRRTTIIACIAIGLSTGSLAVQIARVIAKTQAEVASQCR